MADDMQLVRKGKQLWMGDIMVAECASEGIAQLFRLAMIRGKVSKDEAELLMAVFG